MNIQNFQILALVLINIVIWLSILSGIAS